MVVEDLGLQRRAVGAADRHRRRGLGDLDYSGRRRVGGSHLYDVVQERNAEQDSSGPHIGDRTCDPRGHADHRVEPPADVSGGFHRRSPLPSRVRRRGRRPSTLFVMRVVIIISITSARSGRLAPRGDCGAARHIDMRDCA